MVYERVALAVQSQVDVALQGGQERHLQGTDTGVLENVTSTLPVGQVLISSAAIGTSKYQRLRGGGAEGQIKEKVSTIHIQ